MLGVEEAEAFTAALTVSSGEALESYEGLAKLNDEDAVEEVTNVISARMLAGDPYTTIGANVLVALNPYEPLKKAGRGIYDESVALHYWHRGAHLVSPHIFKVGAQSLAHLTKFQSHQSIIISGESGAGKTEAAKHLLSFVTSIATHKPKRPQRRATIVGGGRRALSVTRALIHANPILEAFGNAATNHNGNSSRFGKLLELRFDGAKVASGFVRAFMLEKGRVVNHAAGESSFHVMRYVLCGAPAELATKLGLSEQPMSADRRGYRELRASEEEDGGGQEEEEGGDGERWRYMKVHGSIGDSDDDESEATVKESAARQFTFLAEAMATSLGINEDTTTGLWQVLGAILHVRPT